jgi:hypothetical protein
MVAPVRGIDWLREQAIRMRRTKWPNAVMLADELWLMLRGLDSGEADSATIRTTIGDDIQIDGEDINIPPFDPVFPDIVFPDEPSVDEDPDTGETTVVQDQYVIERTVVPGQVTGGGSPLFPMTIYPMGNLTSSAASSTAFSPANEPASLSVQVRQLDGGTPDVSDWAMVTVIREMLYTTTTTYNAQGGITNRNIDVSVVQSDYSVQPGGGGAGGAIAVVVDEISSRDGTTAGTGTATIHSFDGTSWTPLVDELGEELEPQTIYNSVSASIASGKVIQVKKIGGFWFIDVEDCSQATEPPVIEG